MREIKFRAWIREGEWDEAGEMQAYKMCYDLAFEDFEPINDLLARVENLMQYTGIKDRSGREIYEGDCIRMETEDGDVKIWEIIFQTETEDETQHYLSGFTGKFIKDVTDEIYDENGNAAEGWTGEIEIIGNIYENPELLKV